MKIIIVTGRSRTIGNFYDTLINPIKGYFKDKNKNFQTIHFADQVKKDNNNDNLYIAIGYLPGKNTEYAFILNGSENLMSKFEIKKDINGFNLSFNLNDDLTNIGNAREANIELNKVF